MSTQHVACCEADAAVSALRSRASASGAVLSNPHHSHAALADTLPLCACAPTHRPRSHAAAGAPLRHAAPRRATPTPARTQARAGARAAPTLNGASCGDASRRRTPPSTRASTARASCLRAAPAFLAGGRAGAARGGAGAAAAGAPPACHGCGCGRGGGAAAARCAGGRCTCRRGAAGCGAPRAAAAGSAWRAAGPDGSSDSRRFLLAFLPSGPCARGIDQPSLSGQACGAAGV